MSSMEKSAFGSNPVVTPLLPELLSPSEVAFHLRALIGKRADDTNYEKFQLLEERDKILRKGGAQISYVNGVAAMQGTCGDMCPEKEIYQRQTQNRISQFELDPETGEVDHMRVIKEYVRSSVDQDDLLPHNLRSGPVLMMTMDYLLAEIARHAPDNDNDLRNWYDFMWDKTRAIRKEITLQMITDKTAVDLMEKCVRFHIFAAHHLCHLDDFDQNTNTENLTECIQTLRYLYENCSNNGMSCVNECEFRAYDILLNVSDTDILQNNPEVASYKQEVRHSEEVRLALQLFTTYKTNNYVRFFQLIRERASYLQASVAHRYFNIIRKNAILSMAKAYGTNLKIAVNDLVRMLGFESDTEVLEFCAIYGFDSVENGTHLLLSRTRFDEPENPPPVKRADTLIGDKMVGRSVGELLTGGRLYAVDLPEPVISFDENNCYLYDPVIVPYLHGQSVTSAQTIQRQRQQEFVQTIKSLGMSVLTAIIKQEVNTAIVAYEANELQ